MKPDSSLEWIATGMAPAHLFQHVAWEVPSFAPVLAEHLKDNGELLPHVLMSDLLRFVGARVNQNGAVRAEVLTILGILEKEVPGGNAETVNAIEASFLENLEAEPFFAELYALFGPKLRAAHRPFAWDPSSTKNAV